MAGEPGRSGLLPVCVLTPASQGHQHHQPLGNSVVVWHVIEDAATRNAFPTPAANTMCRIPIRFLKSLTASGASHDLVWANGTPAKIRIALKSTPGATTSVEVQKLP